MSQEILRIKYIDHPKVILSHFIYSIIWKIFPVHLQCTWHGAHDKGKGKTFPKALILREETIARKIL